MHELVLKFKSNQYKYCLTAYPYILFVSIIKTFYFLYLYNWYFSAKFYILYIDTKMSDMFLVILIGTRLSWFTTERAKAGRLINKLLFLLISCFLPFFLSHAYINSI